MSNIVFSNIIRIVIVLFIQITILNRLDLSIGSFNYIHLFLYPVLILFLPLNTPRVLIILVSFIVGITMDMFFNSPGIHASALLTMAFGRKYILQFLEPTEGYKMDTKISLSNMGFAWLTSYTAILLFIHLSWYFSVEAFSFVYFQEILLRIISSFLASFVIIVLFIFIYNPKN